MLDLASSIDTAINLTPVSSVQSSYSSAIVFNSALHGLHHVAQKLIMIGLPLLLNLDRFLVTPFTSFKFMLGNWE